MKPTAIKKKDASLLIILNVATMTINVIPTLAILNLAVSLPLFHAMIMMLALMTLAKLKLDVSTLLLMIPTMITALNSTAILKLEYTSLL
jgi:membrane-associated HD superfamily phosphohydrolase